MGTFRRIIEPGGPGLFWFPVLLASFAVAALTVGCPAAALLVGVLGRFFSRATALVGGSIVLGIISSPSPGRGPPIWQVTISCGTIGLGWVASSRGLFRSAGQGRVGQPWRGQREQSVRTLGSSMGLTVFGKVVRVARQDHDPTPTEPNGAMHQVSWAARVTLAMLIAIRFMLRGRFRISRNFGGLRSMGSSDEERVRQC